MIGIINPKVSNGHRFILIVIDWLFYEVSWVYLIYQYEAKAVKKFLKRDIICRYGLPEIVIIDNAHNLNGLVVHNLFKQMQVKHFNFTPYRLYTNEAVEAANKNKIKKIVVTYTDYHEMLPYALHIDQTIVRTLTGVIPYSKTYGMEVVLPIEMEIPSLQILMEVNFEDNEWVWAKYEWLNMIEGRRLEEICHRKLYQKRMSRVYNKKVWPCEQQVGELHGALILTNMDREEVHKPINSNIVKNIFLEILLFKRYQ